MSSPVVQIKQCPPHDEGDYNVGLHIMALFIIFAMSCLGTMMPALARSNRLFKVADYHFLLLKSFGMGVILATGFVHMFSPADAALTDACLPDSWLKYSSWAGLFALLSSLSVQFIQTIAINHFQKKHHHSHSHCKTHEHKPQGTIKEEDLEKQIGLEDSPSSSTTHHVREREESKPVELGALAVATNIHSDGCCEVDHVLFQRDSHQHRQITAYILELGVATHSIIIGITLGVTRSSEFTGLLIAISFHQFFEGFALSTTALEAGFKTLLQPVLMALAYTLTTPLGIAIGIGIASSYESGSSQALLTQGVLDAVSAGILIYDALVNLITANITHNRLFSEFSPMKKFGVFFSLWLGAGFMSLLALWA